MSSATHWSPSSSRPSNAERTLAETLLSVLSADLPNIEVFVVDDGSERRHRRRRRSFVGR